MFEYYNMYSTICICEYIALPTKYVHIKSTTVYAPRRNWDSPPSPHPQASVPPAPCFRGRGTLAGEKGVGRVPIPTRGIHCGTLYMYVLCDGRAGCISSTTSSLGVQRVPVPHSATSSMNVQGTGIRFY